MKGDKVMKKLVKTFILLVAVFAAAAGNLASVYAESETDQCIFEGASDDYFYNAETGEPMTELFDYSQAVPGKDLTARILLKNDESRNLKANLFITVYCENDSARLLMSDMSLSFKQEKPTSMFATPLVKSGKVIEEIKLGMIYSGCETVLIMTINIPDVSEEILETGLAGLRWKFRCDEGMAGEADKNMRERFVFSNETWLKILIVSLVVLVVCEIVKAKLRRARV